ERLSGKLGRSKGPESMLRNGLPLMPEIDALALRTDRLDLIPITRTHAPAMFQVLKDPVLYEYVTSSPPADVAELTRLYEFLAAPRSPDGSELWFNWVLKPKGQREPIGHVQAGVLSEHANVAWFLGIHWQRLGYATEAAKAVVDLLVRIGVRKIRAS